MEWHWPWAFILLPLPWLMRAILPAKRQAQTSLEVPHLTFWPGEHSSQISDNKRPDYALWALALIAWICLVTALARPYVAGEVVDTPVSGRDLMLAVDISGSMDVEDMQWQGRAVNRLFIVKQVLNDFIEQRNGDRLGLILFGSEAHLQAPLTFDTKTVQQFLNEAVIGLAGKKTAIGDAIGLGIKRLIDKPQQSRVLVLLTDGENTAGQLEPVRAAELAAQTGIKIYTIGLGAEAMEIPSFFGNRTVNPSRDLDEAALTRIAKLTGGAYFRASSSDELQQIYQLIDQIEPNDSDSKAIRPQQSLFHWPLLAALITISLLSLVQRLQSALAASGLFKPNKRSES